MANRVDCIGKCRRSRCKRVLIRITKWLQWVKPLRLFGVFVNNRYLDGIVVAVAF